MWLVVIDEKGESRFSLNSLNIVRLQVKNTGGEDCLLWADTVDSKGGILTRGSRSWCEKYFNLIIQEKDNPGLLNIPEKEKK